MAELYFSAVSTFEAVPDELPAVGCFGAEAVAQADDFQLRVAPSGVSVKGRYWREGHLLKAVVHVQAAGAAPKRAGVFEVLKPIGDYATRAMEVRAWVAKEFPALNPPLRAALSLALARFR